MKWFAKRQKCRKLPVKATFAGRPIRSAYVLNRLRNTKWEDHETIISLTALEGYVLWGPTGCDTARHYHGLQQHYPDAVDAIEAELLSADELATRQNRHAEVERDVEKAKAAGKALKEKEDEKLIKEWLALGGKP